MQEENKKEPEVKVVYIDRPRNLTEAILYVMAKVRNIEKNSTISAGGSSSYKGVKDMDVKLAMSEAMIEAGLIILPIKINGTTTVYEWIDEYKKRKTTYFTEVKPVFLLKHTSGESQEIEGLGHGMDSQDKSPGKAMTYAQKYALLYTFMVATGTIDDADATHSDKIETPQTQPAKDVPSAKAELPWLNTNDKEKWEEAKKFITGGGTITKIKTKYRLNKEVLAELTKLVQPAKPATDEQAK